MVRSLQSDVLRLFASSLFATSAYYSSHVVVVVAAAALGASPSSLRRLVVSKGSQSAAAESCSANCYDLSCDEWGSMYGVDCVSLEANNDCSCAGCACPLDEAKPLAVQDLPAFRGDMLNAVTTKGVESSSSCAASDCYGFNCDEWAERYEMDCQTVELNGCSCSGCTCPLDEDHSSTTTTMFDVDSTSTTTHKCEECFGMSCDDWGTSMGFKCSDVERHGCSCAGCECELDDDTTAATKDTTDADSWTYLDTCNVANCVREHSCDYLVQHGTIDFSCHALESFYQCDCGGCSCPDEPASPVSYCQVGNETDTIKCPGVESEVMLNRVECEMAATTGRWALYTWSEAKFRCQLMNSTDLDDGRCRSSNIAEYLLYAQSYEECGASENQFEELIKLLHELYGNFTTPEPCDRDCFNRFDVEYNDPGFCADLIADGHSCDEYFCSADVNSTGCIYSGYCDQACGICENGCAAPPSNECDDVLDLQYGAGTCIALVNGAGYSCGKQFCSDPASCQYAGYCDQTCGLCRDTSCRDIEGFVDSEGIDCSGYFTRMWCASNGEPGLQWDRRWGDLDDWTNEDGVPATEACCACGGGVECTDVDNDGICDDEDSCPFDSSNDADHDGICQDVDSCPLSKLNDCGTTSAIATLVCPSEYELRLVLESGDSSDILQTSTLLDINDCALQCESVAGCVGIRYSPQTLACVLLSTYEIAPDSSSSDPFAMYTCVFTRESTAPEGFNEVLSSMGTSGACRQYAARPGYVADGSFSTIERHDIESCAVACQSSAKCLGFEFSYLNANCELWTVLPSAVYPIDNFHCYVKHDDSSVSTATPHNVNDELMAAGSLSGPFAVFNDGVCPGDGGWTTVNDMQVCANAVDYLDAAVLEQESSTGNPAGCYFDESTNKLVFNTVVGTASSTGVNTKAARLLVCLLGATGFTTSASGSSAAPCDWSAEQTQTYLSGCTADLCFQYRSFEAAAAACEAFGNTNCGGVTSVLSPQGVIMGYETRSSDTPLASKQASSSWVYSCGDVPELCRASCFGFTCDELEDMQNTYTCSVMEDVYNCDCSSCRCKSLEPAECAATCFGETCDAWASRSGYPCAVLEQDFLCDCQSCVCAA